MSVQVPKNTSSHDILVNIDVRHILVKDRKSHEVYLHGELWRGVVPEESMWINGSGDGEDGFVVQLTKMNLELLSESWEHSHSWWEKLFTTESYR